MGIVVKANRLAAMSVNVHSALFLAKMPNKRNFSPSGMEYNFSVTMALPICWARLMASL